MLKIIILLLLATVLQAQIRPNSIQGWHLSPSAKDTIKQTVHDSLTTNRTWTQGQIADSLRVVADTTGLKQLECKVGSYAFLAGLSSPNSVGGGFFVGVDSTYPEGTIAFSSATSGKQFVRVEWLEGRYFNVRWTGAKGDGVTDDREAIQKAIDYIIKGSDKTNIVYLPEGDYMLSRVPGKHYCLELYARLALTGSGTGNEVSAKLKLMNNQVATGDSVCMLVDSFWKIYSGDSTGSYDWWHWGEISNLYLDCNGGNQNGKVNGIAIYQPGEVSLINNLMIKNFKGWAYRQHSSAPFRMANVTVNPASSVSWAYADKERVGFWIDGGQFIASMISGDNMNPMLLLKDGAPIVSIHGFKNEANTSTSDSTVAVICDNVVEYGNLTIDGFRFEGGTTNARYFLRLMGSAGKYPQITLIGGHVPNTQHFICNTTGDNNYYIDADQRVGFYSYGGGIHIRDGFNSYRYNKGDTGIKLQNHVGDYIKAFRYASDQQLHITSPWNTIMLETHDGTDIASFRSGYIEHELGTGLKGVRIGGWNNAYSLIDSAKVEADTLFFYVGSNKYKAVK